MKEKLRLVWHKLYYGLSSTAGTDFAMTCQKAIEQIDLREPGSSPVDRFRFKLHMSLCRSCSRYLQMSGALNQAIRDLLKESDRGVDLEKINRELLEKHSASLTRAESDPKKI